MFLLTDKIEFPDPALAMSDGLLAVGGDLSIERLLHAYHNGIFPWFEHDDLILWWSPDPRFVLFPKGLKVSKSMKQFMRKHQYKITHNQAFETVILECSQITRTGEPGTWITPAMKNAYINLHRLGYAKSVEVWDKDQLIGGFYGVDLGNGIFCGESMFSKASNASKLAFIDFVQNSDYQLIDCQVYTPHLESLGAEEIRRSEFIKYLKGKK